MSSEKHLFSIPWGGFPCWQHLVFLLAGGEGGVEGTRGFPGLDEAGVLSCPVMQRWGWNSWGTFPSSHKSAEWPAGALADQGENGKSLEDSSCFLDTAFSTAKEQWGSLAQDGVCLLTPAGGEQGITRQGEDRGFKATGRLDLVLANPVPYCPGLPPLQTGWRKERRPVQLQPWLAAAQVVTRRWRRGGKELVKSRFAACLL